MEITLHVSLPEHLQQRVRVVTEGSPESVTHGEFVLYWMHHAVRAHENPALDVAILYAESLGLPVVVYHALSEDYPFASDRHHAFILQGARDVQREMKERGISYYFHLQRQGNRGPHLRDLTRRAAVLVTEEMPVQPVVGWLERLLSLCSTPILSVDASCVVTPQRVGRSFTRAFEFRDAVKGWHVDEVGKPYPEVTCSAKRFCGEMPFQSIDLQDVSLASLIAQCRIDHLVAPVSDSPGGSRAGYARWNQFKVNGLARYEKRRNDATIHDGVSRLSAYLHYGMVSVFRIARESWEHQADKFLDELLIWRELAFHYCYFNRDHVDTLEAIPNWARQTLEAHVKDPRDEDHSWESLARAQSGTPLWDLCQTSLLRHGELHNNLRMTWGKAVFPWASTPARVLQLLIDLNHRYALDGRDPSSYGGILWCLGQFDRPFRPEQPIIGSVRPRPIEQHEKRVDLARFRAIVHRPIAAYQPSVAIVGAGLGGLIAARTLMDHGLKVKIFEKSRGVGGRLATRREDLDGGTKRLLFDHGAQYFTVRDERFAKYAQSWMHDELIEPWKGRIVELARGGRVVEEKDSVVRYVPVPSMSALAKHLAEGLDIELNCQVSKLDQAGDQSWSLLDGAGEFIDQADVVIVNAPAPQAESLLPPSVSFAHELSQAEMQGCWAMMLQTDHLGDLPFAGAFINEGSISWISRDSSKPGRERQAETWVVHASPTWTQEHIESTPEKVQALLLSELESCLGRSVRQINFSRVHRWRYAIPKRVVDRECLWDATMMLGACGDWCGGPKIEGAFLSGAAMAGTLLRHLTIDRAPWQPAVSTVQGELF